MYLIFDTETTGLPKRWGAPVSDLDNWPRCVQIAWQLHDEMGACVDHQDYLIVPEGFNIPFDAEKIHGISTELAQTKGTPLVDVLDAFSEALSKAKFVVGQNVGFDLNIMGAEYLRIQGSNPLEGKAILDTCTEDTASMCKIPGGRGGKFKLPTLTELHHFLFGVPFNEAHNATADVEATARCFFELIRTGRFSDKQLKVDKDYLERFKSVHLAAVDNIGLKHVNLQKASADIVKAQNEPIAPSKKAALSTVLTEAPFAHLHNHTQFSILQSTTSIDDLVKTAAAMAMPAVALTDHANMMGAFHFVKAIQKHNQSSENQLKGILGCEFQVCENHLDKTFKDNGYQVVFLAKNKIGYKNLSKMSSIGFTQGFYYVPRIDKDIIERYKEGIIVLTGNLYGEVPSKLLNLGENQAEEALLWWKSQFGDDLYIELMRHGQEDEDRINPSLIQLSKTHDIKLIATNNTYYTKKDNANAHDILLCVKDGEKQQTPIGRGRGYRYGLDNQEYYFKSSDEMKQLFIDIPEAITNIAELLDKIEPFDLARNVLLPKFEIPAEFVSENPDDRENAYLKHLTFQGAQLRYGNLSPEIEDRLNFELATIANTGYPGYFLIVADFIRAAREMGVSVGPGRGSAAGSAVAYCLKITNIDPIQYNLLFERFLNPDRISMPDIDIDFDDEGRSKVIDYVIEKYGSNQVAQIITYGTMAAKSAIRDTARVLDLPLNEADRLAKLVPDMWKLDQLFSTDEKELSNKLRKEDMERTNQLLNIAEGEDLESETINQARILEGSLRNTGTHACGVIITPGDISEFVPIATAKDSDMFVTQFDNAVVEEAGLLKMDFLGLRTLTIIKDTVKIVKAKHGIALDPDQFPLDDTATFELFQQGETVGIFQYESVGMQKYLKELKPTKFDDLIAMNALYRPGPIEYIPQFIKRKHGEEEIEYDLPEMASFLEETYGITVYQEQVMLLSQKLADFTKGEADILRKAMGKKQKEVLDKMKPKFVKQASAKGHDATKLEKIWKDWESFASYAFNKSHSTCYAWIAYQTAYLKANYPAEYMAAVLSNNMSDIKKVTFFMEECKRMKVPVLGPDVNESYYKFSVNKDSAIRFGLGAIKGVGSSAVDSVVSERKQNGPFLSVFDLTRRIDLRSVNKKSFESMANAGAFDCFEGTHRAQYFFNSGDGQNFLEKALRYGNRYQDNENAAQVSLFGDSSEVQMPEPEIPDCPEWGAMEKLAREKEVVGIYISGHPLDDYRVELNTFCNATLELLQDLSGLVNKDLSFGGVVTDVQHRINAKGSGWASFVLEDYSDSYTFRIFGEDYMRFRHLLVANSFLYIRAHVKPGWDNKETGKAGDPRITFSNMQLLQDVMDAMAEKLSIQLNLKDIDEELINAISSIIDEHNGKHNLRIEVYDMEESIKLSLPSRNYKVNISQELLKELEEQQIHYKLN